MVSMMKNPFRARAHPIRKITREVLAISFWLHASFLSEVYPAFHLSKSVPTAAYNVLTVAFIAYYSLLANFGWLSVVLDVFFIYLWPLVLLWRLTKVFSVQAYQWLKRRWKEAVAAATITPPISDPLRSEAKQRPLSAINQAPSLTQVEDGPRSTFGLVMRPLSQFVLLWSLVMLNTQSRVLMIVAALVVFLNAIKAIVLLRNFLANTDIWVDRFKATFAVQLTSWINVVNSASSEAPPDPAKQAANSLWMFHQLWGFVADNKLVISRWTNIVLAIVTVPFYLYISVIFAFMYIAIARLNHLQLPWQMAVIDSAFIPFAYTDLPANIWIKLLGGTQALAITLLGYNIVSSRMARKVEALAGYAASYRSQLEDESLQAKVVVIRRASLPQTKPEASRP